MQCPLILDAHETHDPPERKLSMPNSVTKAGAMPRSRTTVTLFLLGWLACWFAPSLPAASMRTIFFGDSLTAGYGLSNPSVEAYPALIQDKIDAAQLGWRTVNAGLSGETTSGGLRRVDWILRQPVDIFVLALGANDGLRGINPAVSRENLQQIIERVRAKNPAAKIVLAGMQMPAALGADYTRAFSGMFPAVAQKYDATLIPFLLEGVGGRLEYNLSDRIHPNAAGHVLIAETVWATLKPLLTKGGKS
jgi:acyl-CoA thioesterase I